MNPIRRNARPFERRKYPGCVCVSRALPYPPAPAPSPRPPRTLWGNRPSFAASASTTPYAAAFLERKTQHYNNKFSISIIYITRYTAYAQLNSHNQQRNVRPQQGAGPSPCTTGGGTINHHVATGTWPTWQRPMRRPQAPASHHDAPRKAVAHAMRQRSMAARTVSKAGSDRSLPLVLLSTCWTSWPPVAVVS